MIMTSMRIQSSKQAGQVCCTSSAAWGPGSGASANPFVSFLQRRHVINDMWDSVPRVEGAWSSSGCRGRRVARWWEDGQVSPLHALLATEPGRLLETLDHRGDVEADPSRHLRRGAGGGADGHAVGLEKVSLVEDRRHVVVHEDAGLRRALAQLR